MATIRRKAYHVTRRGKQIYVPSTKMVDRGERGKWVSRHKTPGIGPLKKGTLMGYNGIGPVKTRRATLSKVVDKFGPLSTFRKLNAVSVYTKRTSPSRSKTYKTDRNWVKKNFM